MSKRDTETSIRKICPICGKIHYFGSGNNYCAKHYDQMLRYGKILDHSPRSIYDPNEYRIVGDTTYISVYNKLGEKLPEEVIIDTRNISLFTKYKIYIRLHNRGNKYYAYCNIARNNKVKLHQIICPTNLTVDHINGNTLDNRECNLRPADMTLQNLNKKGTLGVQMRKDKNNKVNGFAATMGYKRKRFISKYYTSIEEAQYYRYLLLQLLPFSTNYNLDFMKRLTDEQKDIINKDFKNRLKNQVL